MVVYYPMPYDGPGMYRNWKGNMYQVIGTSCHTENEETTVVYRSQDGELYNRPLEMFNEDIHRDGTFHGPRFTKVGE